MNSAESLTSILIVILMIMIFILMSLAVIYIVLKMKSRKKEQDEKINDTNKQPISDAKKIAKEYTKESIFKFMEFDKIEDNMIIQKNGNRYLMVVECQGVNYDLMSETEKMSIEEGFLQFLNTLRHPIQIYVQTRTVNLNESLEGYRKKLEKVEDDIENKRKQYMKNIQSGEYSKEELEREFYEVTKQTNLYEYGKDIILNTEKMSLNKNVLNKKYYIIIPYYPDELGNGAFDKEEIKNLAFSELYTKSQSIIRTLSACEVSGKIMTSEELIDLLYVAYNRDEAEVFSVDRAIRSGYEELYTTAPDILDKKMELLDKEVEKRALTLINEKVTQVRSRKQQEIEEKEANFGEIIRRRAEALLRQNASYIGKDTTKEAIEMIQEDKKIETSEKENEIKENKTKNSKENKEDKNNINSKKSNENKKMNEENTKENSSKKQTKRGRPKKEIETNEKGGDSNVEEESEPKKRGRKPKTSK